MISLELEYFDLRKICNSGQIFRMYERKDGIFDVYSGDRHLRLRQHNAKDQQEETGAVNRDTGKSYSTDLKMTVNVDLDCTQQEFDSYWKRYFDLERDYGEIVRTAMKKDRSGRCSDEFVAQACAYGAGIRILHQDIWEMLISFIISQQKQIPSIRKCIEALCERFGERMDGWYAFPTPEAIAGGGLEGLKGLSLGYRERYIYETAVRYLTEGLPYDRVESMGLEAALDYFTSFCGVGVKVANCVCLFGAGYVDAFPIDTHIKDILYREYYLKNEKSRIAKGRCGTGPETGAEISAESKLSQADYEELVRANFDRFRGYRGIVQQWIFAKEVSGR
ncbi:MAG: hypothetical protein K6G45_11205 [Lachnospiraceae bacterium]|nr:hypothetical protein [Lachnospiraceae bacterium]